MPRQRVLLAVLVYNGGGFVPECLRSAAGARVGHRDVDVLVLDDASPDEGWGEELRGLCDQLGLGYYRSPRNLGIPRNMNLALGRAQAGGYDYVFIVNSDAVLPLNMVGAMIRVAESNAGVGSVTAWSNNVSVFSIPNDDATGTLKRQDMVDWISAELERHFGPFALDVPTGVGFCMMIPVPVLDQVGLFDPVYGRGYCEEVDWCLRSRAMGYRAVLAPSTFVFHLGSASTIGAGMLADRETTVMEHERIVDLRYPWYRADVDAFFDAGTLPPLVERATGHLVRRAAAQRGYDVEVTWMATSPAGDRVKVVVDPDGRSGALSAGFCGFRSSADIPGGDLPATLMRMMRRAPSSITVSERGAFAEQLAAAWQGAVPFVDDYRYPQRV